VRSLPPSPGDIFDLRVSLRYIEPTIWRGLSVPADVPLAALHEILQVAFGWQNSHLHDFHVGDIRFGMTGIEDEMLSVDERAAPLGAVAQEGSFFVYQYDFGDSWEHDINVERVHRDRDETIRCTAGARACPPEDCGGAPGYAHLLEVLANPKDEEYADLKRWVGRSFDPEKFELVTVRKKLATLSKRLARWRR
jgi:pRiA4b ORF-3-like protein